MTCSRVHILFIATLGAALAAPASGASLKVSPARILIQDVAPGRLYDVYRDTGVQLTLYNDDAVERTWNLSVHRPSERGPWEMGYAEIPDASWCRFDVSEIAVPPGGKAHAGFYVEIPDEECYYNQHWVVTLGIGGASGRRGISLAADIRVQIETKFCADTTVPPHGRLGLAPHKRVLEEVLPGMKVQSEMHIYNNTESAAAYTFHRLMDEVAVKDAYVTSGYSRLPEASWLTHPEQIHIASGEFAVVPIEIHIPEDAAHFGKKWEELLLVQSDAGDENFLRLQVITKESR